MTDRDIDRKLGAIRTAFQKLYNPKTAFGNIKLIKLAKEAELYERIKEETEQCGNCEEGNVKHECNCEHCSYEGDVCGQCHGEGRLPKTPSTI